MSDNQTILEFIARDETGAVTKKIAVNLEEIEQKASQADRGLRAAGEGAGLTERQFNKLGVYGRESLFLLSGSVSQVNKDLSALIDKGGRLGEAAFFGGGLALLVTGAATGIGLLASRPRRLTL